MSVSLTSSRRGAALVRWPLRTIKKLKRPHKMQIVFGLNYIFQPNVSFGRERLLLLCFRLFGHFTHCLLLLLFCVLFASLWTFDVSVSLCGPSLVRCPFFVLIFLFRVTLIVCDAFLYILVTKRLVVVLLRLSERTSFKCGLAKEHGAFPD